MPKNPPRWQRGWRVADRVGAAEGRAAPARSRGGRSPECRPGPARGVRHAVAEGEATTECGMSVSVLTLWDIDWPGDRGAIVCTACAIAVVRATEAD